MRLKRFLLIILTFHFFFFTGSPVYIWDFHHALVTVIVGYWLYKNGIPYTPLNYPIYAMVIIWFITSITSLSPRMAFESLWVMLLHVIIFFAIADFIQKGRQRLVMEIMFLFTALVIIISSIELFSWYFGLGFLPQNAIGWFDVTLIPLKPHTLSLPMGFSTLLAAFVAPLITVTIGWALTARQKDYRRTLWIMAGALFVILILTVSRGGLLSLGGALGAFAVMRFMQTRRIPLYIIISGAVIGIIAIVAIFTLRQTSFSGDTVRIDLYRSAVEIGVDHPITGVGVGNYGRALREYRTPTLARDRMASAHNLYLNTFAETGLLGAIVGTWLGITVLQTWWQVWSQQKNKIRVEASIAAIIGIGVHSMVDTITSTNIVMIMLVPFAYSVIGYRSALDPKPSRQRIPAIIAMIILIGYAIFWFQIDRAQYAYGRSLAAGDHQSALEHVKRAQELDPHLNLYQLHETFVLGQIADETRSSQDIATAITAYEHALELEPTWDVGWVNLGTLYMWQGDFETAIRHMEQARAINPLHNYGLYIAQLRDEQGIATEDDIDLYYENIDKNGYLPLSDYWQQTPYRRAALERYIANAPLEIQYRTLVEIDPERAYQLVPDNPQTATEHWIAGDYALTVQNDPALAQTHFNQAVKLNKLNGDYYVARAKSTVESDPDAAQRDLQFAYLLGTRYEYPNLVWMHFAESDEEVNTLLQIALPRLYKVQQVAAILYGGRPARFNVFPEMRIPGPGRAVMEPWYRLAERYAANGEDDKAQNTYQAIVNYAPDETEALQHLNEQQQ